ncbi:hypothetical protein ACFFJY_05480 [Fictibacillus aquaticus]|uniref:Uncharacterized protein n=1 Tax=Fictibacillus aquaticus TaxID=2021314 RepID=A0A235F4H1_9BACL|nr:hypothetical protein [Fictibacillus aquaticus]OYD56149.1 hypothetical protein CGZ90_19055 [Fictibacillus aquaticus]
MFKYGFINYFEAQLTPMNHEIMEIGPWTNVYLSFEVADRDKLPDDLQDPGGLAVYDSDGELKDLVVLNEGTDSEYKFTDLEKEQLYRYLSSINDKE